MVVGGCSFELSLLCSVVGVGGEWVGWEGVWEGVLGRPCVFGKGWEVGDEDCFGVGIGVGLWICG